MSGLHRFADVAGGFLAAAIAALVVGFGPVSNLGTPAKVPLLIFAGVLFLVVAAVARRLRYQEPSARAQRRSRLLAMSTDFADMELGIAMVAGCFALFAVSGGLESELYPLLYGVVAFSASFLTRRAVAATLLAAALLELLAFFRGGSTATVELVIHGLCLLAAASLHAFFLRAVVSRYRRQHARRIADELTKQRESARDYRLISSSLGADSRAPRSREDEEMRLAVGAVESVRDSLFHTLTLVKRAIGAQTCILLWMDERTEELKIKELVTDSEDISERDRVGQSGVLGAVVRDRALLCLPQTRPGQVPYYEATHAAGAFLGVPVMDGQHLRGVLCADRTERFTDRETSLLSKAAEQVMRFIRTEQVFAAVERAKYEHERFYLASAMLCRALTLEQVMNTAFDAASQIADYDLGIVALYDRDRRKHRIHSIRANSAASEILAGKELRGYEYRDNSGLASMVVKNKHYLPAGGELRDASTPIFTKKMSLKNAESLLVLPLISADEAIGTLTLASRKRHRFAKDVREMLGVIANQVAISLQNALMFQKMETMATTDGLTGLTNHRTFQERFANLLERSERHGHQAAVLLCDVDHFKSVNDTYGHPVGDEVLRQVARVLQGAVRKIDIPARYGGEEFAVVLEATGEEGAVLLANRIREDVGKLVVDSDKGEFSVTMSIGVAVYPDNGSDRAVLIERADMALYHAKQNGRNRVVSYGEFHAAKVSRRAS
jgi:diguanylate cyclase (GGDEF)-like protein